MTQEQKELLLEDLCARLPYGVICEDAYGNVLELNSIDKPNIITFKCASNSFWTTDLDKCKPYLFPMSSMTEEIMDEIYNNTGVYDIDVDSPVHIEVGTTFEDLTKMVNILHKHHIDYRGLIPMGLAIDATNLNIY